MAGSTYTDAGKSASAPGKQEASDPSPPQLSRGTLAPAPMSHSREVSQAPLAESSTAKLLMPYSLLAGSTSALPRSGAKSPRRERHERRAGNAEAETEGSLRKGDRAVVGGKEGEGRKSRPRTPTRSGAKSVRREKYEREQSESGRSVVL